ncbi:uncharacterized protein BJ212DRAFT_1303905 [Suillus subaureus]|uniref:Uncharacterized protein n=1 Tax=Suillus subaureus TaxID=48587 RepID=A0A9P7J701_9AGAM|nr:uncharacterized protein BJ212DRAFT_1303905 [Suillus subaureus]KAG1805844.1 hypothetical protein BJ212DRAFT_1303905 [Suillus subaureus]
MLSVQLCWSFNLQPVYQDKDLGQSSWLKKSIRSKQEEIISKGFSNLSLTTLYQLFKSKLAGWEAACQHLVTMTWELEVSEWYMTFLDGLYHENKDCLLFSDEELKRIRNVFADWSQEEIDDDVNYLQAVYDDNCEILRAVTAQADVLKKHLGSRALEDVLGSMGKSSHYLQFVVAVAQPFPICTDAFNLGVRNSQHKGKTKIPKPTRESGLNLSSLPAVDQLNLPTEQPQMSAFDFNPYGQTQLQWQGMQQPSYGNQNQPLYGHAQDQAPAQEQSLYGDREEQGQSLYGDAQDHGQAWYGGMQGPSTYGDVQGPSIYGDAQGPSTYGDVQGLSFYEQDLSLNADRQEYDSYDHFWDALDSGPTDFPPDAGPSVYPGVTTPVPRWIEDAPDKGISIIDQGNGLSPLASDLALIRQGQIPPSEVTMGPAWTMTMHTVQRANMPPTPYLILRKSGISLMRLFESQSRNSLGQTEFITSARCQVVSNALSVRCGKMVKFAHEGVCDAFQLFPLQGHALPADQYHANGNMIIRTKFQSHFVMVNVIRFVWYWGYASFLGKSPLKAIKYVLCVAGTATHCALHEQGKHSLEVDPFGGQIHQSKFNKILNVIDRLTPAEKAELKQYLQYVLVIGPSQARDNMTSDSDSM